MRVVPWGVVQVVVLTIALTACGESSGGEAEAPSTTRSVPTEAATSPVELPNGDFAQAGRGWTTDVTAGELVNRRAAKGVVKLNARHGGGEGAGVVELLSTARGIQAGTAYRLSSILEVSDTSAQRGARQRITWRGADGRALSTTQVGEERDDRVGRVDLQDKFRAPEDARSATVRTGLVIAGGDKVAFGVRRVMFEALP